MKTVRDQQSLLEHGLILENEKSAISQVLTQFSVSIPSDTLALIQQEAGQEKSNNKDIKGPLYKQFVPTIEELNSNREESDDPIGDSVFEIVKGIVHRYPDRCLLLPLKACPVYCRFCFRRETVAKTNASLSPLELAAALKYIEETQEIWEVIITGGDPLFLKPKIIKEVITALNKIPHVEVIRIHTRIPILTPKRINDAMLDALQTTKALYIGLHVNHPSEFTEAGEAACAKLVNAGIPIVSQTVLLKDINDKIEILGKLMRMFVKNRIKPYYVHQGDLAKGTAHFRTTLEAGQALMAELRGRYSGLCQPTYVLDIPGGFGKVPICADYLERLKDNTYQVKDYQGRMHEYPPKV